MKGDEPVRLAEEEELTKVAENSGPPVTVTVRVLEVVGRNS